MCAQELPQTREGATAAEAATTTAAAEREPPVFTFRALVTAAVAIVAVVLFIHWAELVQGSRRGHTALANTSIPVGPFFALFCLVGVTFLVRKLRPKWALSGRELLLVYMLMAASCVIASSGGVHFLVPTITAPFYFDTPENDWARFHSYIPDWFSPRDTDVIKAFYMGDSPVPWRAWAVPMLVWCMVPLTFYFGTLCICAMLRRQWVEREKLTFPTVYVPLHMTDEKSDFWRNKLMWLGFAIPFIIGTINTLNLNYPVVPHIEVRHINITQHLQQAPWNAMGTVRASFYPFIIGIAYLLPLDMTFSCWFFYLFGLGQRVFGAATGLNELGQGVAVNRFPFEPSQGAGAFLAITALAIWTGRREFAQLLRSAVRGGSGAEARERWPAIGLLASFLSLLFFCRAAGMGYYAPVALLVLAWAYMTAATRIRAETGNAWLFGPQMDPHMLMVNVLGSARFAGRDLTVMAYLSNISSWDLRCIPMPHQLDAFKMADSAGISQRRLPPVLIAGLAFGLAVAFSMGLAIWYRYGALAELNQWRTNMGKQPFIRLQAYLSTPFRPDVYGTSATVLGLLFTVFLAAMRTRFLWWPFHPVGYAMANTPTMRNTWMPFMISWLVKAGILRYGGAKMYRYLLPFFLGLIVGDFANGGLWTLMGCIFDIHVYPVNW